MAGPWESYAAPQASYMPLTPPNPKIPLEVQHMAGENQLQAGQLQMQPVQLGEAQARETTAQAQAQYANDTARAQRDKAVADARIAQQNASAATGANLIPNSDLHGDAYLKAANIPAGIAAVVRGVASGNVQLPANALKVPYWQQVLQHTLNYDPEFNAADFNTRARTRADYANGKMGINITALNTALGHAGEVLGDVNALGNSGGLIGTSIWNPIANAYLKHSGDPRVTNFNNDTMAFGGELAKVFSGANGGSQGERQDWHTSVPLNGSPQQQVGVLTQDAKLLRSRIEALNEQYKRGMGRTADISDLLDPHARQVYQQLLGPNPGAASAAQAPGDSAPPSGSGGVPPGAGGLGVGDPVSLATGPTRLVNDPKAGALVDQLVRKGASAAEINAAITPLGYPAVDAGDLVRWQQFLRRNPNYRGLAGGGVQRSEPTTAWNRLSGSSIGTGIGAGIDAALGGTTDEIGGAISSAVTGMPLGQSIADANARKSLAFQTHPIASAVGTVAGAGADLYGGAKLLGDTALASGLGRLGPYAGNAAYGAVSGFGENNDNRLGGALLGAAGGVVGQGLGEAAAIPLGALARTRPVQAVQRMFGRGLNAAPRPSAAQSSLLSTINGADPNAIRSTLADAQRLGVPMSLADTAPSLGELAGAAVRRSPNAANMAEATLIPRSRGQYDRFTSAVTRDLGPVGNLPQMSAYLGRQAATDAAPLYERAFEGGSIAPLEHQFQSAFQDSSFAVAQARAGLADAQRRATQTAAGVSRAGDNVYGANAALRPDLDAQGDITAAQQALDAAQATHDGNLARLRQAQADGSAGKKGAIWSPRIQQFLDDPITKSGLARGLEVQRLEALAAGKPFDPSELAITGADAAGNPTVGAVPNMRTLDAVKRGFDEILNEYPRLPGGQLQLDQRGRAVDQVRRALLGELDRLNPDYAGARQAWAGPMASRDALDRGGALYRTPPDVAGMAVQTPTPEHLSQMQLGFRGAMVDHAGRVRDASNPFEATLGSPAARGRVDALYPGNPGTADLFRQRDLEGQLAATSNRVLGNSKTAGRSIADKAFMVGAVPAMAIDGATIMHGGLPVATAGALALRQAANSAAATAVKNRLAKGAIAKADDLIPLVLNTDPAAATSTMDDLVRQQLAYRAYVRASRPIRPLRMFGAGIGIASGSHF